MATLRLKDEEALRKDKPTQEDAELYDFNRSAEEAAYMRAQIVVTPRPNQLQIDIDTYGQLEIFTRRATEFKIYTDDYTVTPSKSGLPHCHITVNLPHDVTDWQRIAMQFALGSDPVREYLSALRADKGIADPTRFFEARPADWVDTFEEKAESLSCPAGMGSGVFVPLGPIF